ncbi:MAG: signal peptidase I [Verrucomicrobiota bacterium]|nr:signal peptidase I [Limisphaera sp.]MDW8382185.1 signal peptidase I [Verrucomicrobiota bacterium]
MRTSFKHKVGVVSKSRRGIGLALALLTCLGLGIARSYYRLGWVQGNSMNPTLRSGDLLLIELRAYQNRPPRRGELVVACWGEDWIVKRIVGLPGERVAVFMGQLYINGNPVPESYPRFAGNLCLAPGRLRPGHYALLGDNRSISETQSIHAVVSREAILGKVLKSFRLWPALPQRGESPLLAQKDAQTIS